MSFPPQISKKGLKKNMFNNSLHIRDIGVIFVVLPKNILKLIGKRFGVYRKGYYFCTRFTDRAGGFSRASFGNRQDLELGTLTVKKGIAHRETIFEILTTYECSTVALWCYKILYRQFT